MRADACKLLRDWGVGCRGLAELRGKTRETGSVNAAAAAAAASEPADAPPGTDCAQGAPLSKPLAEGEGAASPTAPQGEPPRREQAARESLFGLGQRHGLCDKRGKLKAVQVGGRWGLSRVPQGSLKGPSGERGRATGQARGYGVLAASRELAAGEAPTASGESLPLSAGRNTGRPPLRR